MTTKTKKVAAEGGSKGQAIQALLAAHPDWSRKQVAEAASATPQRVGEVVRALQARGTMSPEQKDLAAKVAKSVAKAKAPKPAGLSDIDAYRNVMGALEAGVAVEDALFEQAKAYAKRTKKRAPKR
jgi:hypothetical protein